MIYDLNKEYRRCGHKMESQFGITAEEFQAARHIGGKVVLRDIIQYVAAQKIDHQPNCTVKKSDSLPSGGQPPLAAKSPGVLMWIPAEKVAAVVVLLQD